MWFTISVIVCLCIYVLVKFLFWTAVWPIFGKETVLLAFCLPFPPKLWPDEFSVTIGQIVMKFRDMIEGSKGARGHADPLSLHKFD